MDNREAYIEYIKDIKATFDSVPGKKVLDKWKKSLNATALDRDSNNFTYYRLGQQEFIKSVIQDIEVNIQDLKDKLENSKSSNEWE